MNIMKKVTIMFFVLLLGLISNIRAQIIFNEDFEGIIPPNFPQNWTVLDENNDDNTWRSYSGMYHGTQGASSGTKYLIIEANMNIPIPEKKDWFFVPNISLEAATEYTIRFKCKALNTNYSERIEIWIGSESNVSGMENMIFQHDFSNNSHQEFFTTFTVDEAKNYTLAWRATSKGFNQNTIFLDDIEIEKNAPIITVENLWDGDTSRIWNYVYNWSE